MTGVKPVRLVPNGNGVQLFLAGDVLGDSRCPLRQGQEVPAIVIDGVGVLLAQDRPTGDDARERLTANGATDAARTTSDYSDGDHDSV